MVKKDNCIFGMCIYSIFLKANQVGPTIFNIFTKVLLNNVI